MRRRRGVFALGAHSDITCVRPMRNCSWREEVWRREGAELCGKFDEKWVLRRNHVLSDASKKFSASLAPKWTGPYRVKEIVSSLVYRLADLQLRPISGPVHVCDLKPYYDRGNEWPEGNALPPSQAAASGGTARRSSPVRRYNLRSRRN